MAKQYPDCYAIVEEKVKPERQRLDAKGHFKLRKPLPDKWWIYADKRPALYRLIADLDRVIVIARVTKQVLPLFVSTGQVFADRLAVFTLVNSGAFGVLSSAFHWHWAITYASTLETRIVYTPSDVFETFPQPPITTVIAQAGRALDEHRRALMIANDEGLTKTYNRVHGTDRSSGIERLRELHIALDYAVATAYGWDKLSLDHGWHPTTQGVRFTISPAAQAEVLDRLLELNHQRYAAEVAAGLHNKKSGKAKAKPAATPDNQFPLLTEGA